MKYLKEFNKLFESNNEKLYHLVNDLEWSNNMDNAIGISNSDKKTLRELINSNWGVVGKPEYVNWDFDLSFPADRIIMVEIKNSETNLKSKLAVIKLPDDWYIVREFIYEHSRRSGRSYYKCDSMDGLIELLKDRRTWIYKNMQYEN